MVFYLKYRPQKLADLDLVEVREGLDELVKSGKVPHALLFAGPRGTGKTSAARILAKAVNCLTNKGKGEPCNRCPICQAITDGSALDLIEIDAASNRGIDDVRSLREKIKLSPAVAKFKVYIIDEVHMLTTEAFNALLKTLEEPPEHAIFILCTTAPEKLPETILSRCSRFNFRKARIGEVVSSLKRVVRGEKLKVEKGVLEIIAESVDGSFRDGIKILDQLALSGKKVSLGQAQKILGQIETLSPAKLFVFLSSHDTAGAIKEIGRIVEAGADLASYTQKILDRLRLALLAKVGVENDHKIEGLETIEELKDLIRLFSEASEKLARTPIPQLPLELAVVEWSLRPTQGEVEKTKKATGDNPADFSANPQVSSRTTAPSRTAPVSNRKLSFDQVKNNWSEVLAGVRPLNHSVEALLRATRPIQLDGTFLVIEVFYRFHKEQLEMDKCRRIVEEVAEKVIGAPVKLRCVLGEKKTPQPARPVDQPASPKKQGLGKKESKEQDVIKAAEEIFGTNAN